MKDIFTGLYNKVMSFFQTEKGDNTKDIASNRLKLVLMHDRTKLDPLTLEKMRNEMIDVISRYVIIDQEQLELNLAGEGDSVALMFNIPVVRAKTDEEMAEDEKKRLEEVELAKAEDDDEEETVNEDDDEDENVEEEDDSDEVEEEPEESENEETEDIDEPEEEVKVDETESEEDTEEVELEEEEATEEAEEEAKPSKKSKKKSD